MRICRVHCTVIALLTVAGLSLAGCSQASSPDEPVADDHRAVVALTELLDLRRAGSSDAAAYAPFFSESALATELADSAGESGEPAVPSWDSIYVSSETTESTDVVVIWVADDAFSGWPAATLFTMGAEGDKWFVLDARDVSEDRPEPLEIGGN
ncbi:MAG: hypothetical protein JXR33_04615 [Coriobacteriia bacterium]|nr:hypothetical protein [Coriobacteriia bacterium]